MLCTDEAAAAVVLPTNVRASPYKSSSSFSCTISSSFGASALDAGDAGGNGGGGLLYGTEWLTYAASTASERATAAAFSVSE